MLQPYSIIGLAFGLLIIVADIILLTKRRMPGRMFLTWLVYGIAVCVVALNPSIFYVVGDLFGTEYTLTPVVAIGFAAFLVMFLYLNYRISELQSQLFKLAMDKSVVEHITEIDKRKKREAD